MSTGLSPTLIDQIGSAITANAGLVIPQVCLKLHLGNPGSGTANPSAVTTRVVAYFAAGVDVSEGRKFATTGTPPQWLMTAAETLTYVTAWDALTSGNWLWTARLTVPQTVANGDVFTLGNGMSLTFTGAAA